MTDKVQKIREEVERLKGWNNNVRNSTRHMTLQEEDFNRGKHSSYLEILNFIDSLQEEPAHRTKADVDAAMREVEEKAKLFTAAMNGKSSEQILAEMRGEEPVSKELWEASKQYALRQVLASTDTEMSEQAYLDLRLFSGLELAVAHKDGAKWQKEQFEKNRLAACDRQTEEEAQRESDFVMGIIEKEHRQPTFDDAIKYGMKLQKEH